MMKRSYALTAGLLGFGLLAGFLREILIARLYGVSQIADIFRLAFGLPSILSDGVALSFVAVLLPILSAPNANRRTVLAAAWVFCAVLFSMGWATMGWQARLLAPGLDFAGRSDLVQLGRICWVMCFAVLVSLPLRAIMSERNCIWPTASAPLLRSVGFIATLWIAQRFVDPRSALALACLGAGFLILVIHIFVCRTLPLVQAPATGVSLMAMRPIWLALTSVLLIQALLSAGRILDRSYASLMPVGTVASLEYSYALVMAFGVMFATSVNIWQAPRLNASIAGRRSVARKDVRFGALAIALAFCIGCILSATAPSLVGLVYQAGAFDASATTATASIFAWQALALGPLVAALWLTQLGLISGGKRAVLYLSILKLTIKWLVLFGCLRMGWGTASFGISMLIAECVFALCMLLMMLRAGVLHMYGTVPNQQG